MTDITAPAAPAHRGAGSHGAQDDTLRGGVMQCYHCDNAATATIVSCLQNKPDRWVCDAHATTRGGVMRGRCPDCHKQHEGPCACPWCGEYGITFVHTQSAKGQRGTSRQLCCGTRGGIGNEGKKHRRLGYS